MNVNVRSAKCGLETMVTDRKCGIVNTVKMLGELNHEDLALL